MALGIEPNSIAPQLIQNSGAALVQGIRQIGQQISGHLTELQTKRDLGAMAQEMQGLNVQSNDFPIQLTQLVSKHPLAAQDQRGLTALSILGKAHGQWQATEAEARAFQRAMAMQTARTQATKDIFDYESEKKLGMPQNVGGALVVPKDPVTGQPNVLVPAPSRTSNTPRVLSPGAVLVDPTGKKIAENPKPLTPSVSEARMQKKNNLDLLYKQDTSARQELNDALKRIDAVEKAANAETDPTTRNSLLEKKNQIIEEANAIKKRREDLRKAMETIEATPAEKVAAVQDNLGLPPVPDNAAAPAEVLPALGAVPAAAPAVEMIAVVDPSGRPGRIRASQLEAALQNGYKRR